MELFAAFHTPLNARLAGATAPPSAPGAFFDLSY
jgi:hypothetical protein